MYTSSKDFMKNTNEDNQFEKNQLNYLKRSLEYFEKGFICYIKHIQKLFFFYLF